MSVYDSVERLYKGVFEAISVAILLSLTMFFVYLESYGIPFVRLGYSNESSILPYLKLLLNVISLVVISGIYYAYSHIQERVAMKRLHTDIELLCI